LPNPPVGVPAGALRTTRFGAALPVAVREKNGCGVVAVVGDPDLIVLGVDGDTHGAYDSGSRTPNDSDGHGIALG